MYSPQAQMYERSREAAFALGIALHKGVKVAQYDELCEQDQRDCIDCIGHRWVPGQRRGTCHPATLPPCHPATLPPSHPATLPPSHPPTVPPCHPRYLASRGRRAAGHGVGLGHARRGVRLHHGQPQASRYPGAEHAGQDR